MIRFMKKRLSALLLTLVLLAGLMPAALAAAPSQDEAAQALAALDVMVGDENGDLMLGRAVTRAEFTKMVIAMSASRDSVGSQTSVSPYPDVPCTYWAAPYIEAAVQTGYVQGYLDGTFRPGSTITLAEGVTMALRLLGYSDRDFVGAYPSGQMALYRTLHLDEGLTVFANKDILTRRDAMFLLYNLLTAKTTSGAVYLATLGHALTPSGEIDLVSLINDAMDGPVVAASGWQSSIPFSLSNVTVYRGGALSGLSSIRDGDVLYWSASMRTIWAYTARVTGTYQSVSPSAAAPTSVTVAGRTYGIETAAAAFTLSDLGSCRTGDTVTLLLGRSGGVAAVLTGSQASSPILYGVISSLGTGRYTDAGGNSDSASTVTFTATDGMQYTYPSTDTSLQVGDLVRATASAGTTELKALSSAALTGKMDSGGTKLGSYPLADDVEILDTYGGSAVRVYPSRLAGVTFQNSMVRYFVRNANGALTRLILNDVTGDLHQYGVVTSASEMSSGMTLFGSYAYDIGGVPGVYTSASSVFNISRGPSRFISQNGALTSISNLTPVSLTAVGANTALAGTVSHTLADNVAVYEVRGGDYYFSSLDRVTSGAYSLTGWYDKAESSGGRIRVITAVPAAG